MQKLKFSTGNSKMNSLASYLNLKNTQVVSFDLPAGYTCPNAKLCKAYASPKSVKIIQGKDMIFRCYAASLEVVFKNYRESHWHNFNILKSMDTDSMVELILKSLPKNVKIVRIHSSGDFFNDNYFKAWLKISELLPQVNFFGYTKVLEYVKLVKPSNFKLQYSFGGIQDSEVTDNIPTCKVVEYSSESVCKGKDFEASSEDYFRIMKGESFTLNLHGTQPKNRKAIEYC